MEDVLDVYHRAYNDKISMVCLDERPVQLIGELRKPVPAKPGRKARYDYEYKRNSVANIFMIFEPLKGKRQLQVTQRRTKKDWAKCVKWMVDELYSDSEKIVLVMDNLNTHSIGSLYKAFEPAKARELAHRLAATPALGEGDADAAGNGLWAPTHYSDEPKNAPKARTFVKKRSKSAPNCQKM